MLLTMGLILAFMSAAMEVVLVHNIGFLAKIYKTGFNIPLTKFLKNGPWHVHGEIINIGMSILLSVLVGKVFGVKGGLTIMFAGIVSTLMTEPWFAMERAIGRDIHPIAETKALMLRFKTIWARAVRLYADFAGAVHTTWKGICLFFKVIFFPFVMIHKASLKYNAYKMKKYGYV